MSAHLRKGYHSCCCPVLHRAAQIPSPRVPSTVSLSLLLRLREASSTSHRPPGSYEDAEEPLLERNSAPIALGSVPQTRPRSKSKPDSIFIHPRFNNIARADAAALELGLGGTTDRVSDANYRRTDTSWKHGQGKQQARALLGHTRTRDHHAFGLDDDSSSELSSPS